MGTETLLALLVAAVIVAAYTLWRRLSSRLYFPGGTVPLEAGEDYEFVYIASFTAEEAARSAVKVAEPLGVASKVFPPSEYHRNWSVHWELVSKPDGNRIRTLETKIKAAVSSCGGRFIDLSVSKPGATLSTDAG